MSKPLFYTPDEVQSFKYLYFMAGLVVGGSATVITLFILGVFVYGF